MSALHAERIAMLKEYADEEYLRQNPECRYVSVYGQLVDVTTL